MLNLQFSQPDSIDQDIFRYMFSDIDRDFNEKKCYFGPKILMQISRIFPWVEDIHCGKGMHFDLNSDSFVIYLPFIILTAIN